MVSLSFSQVKIRISSEISISGDEINGLKEFIQDVQLLTNNEVKFEIIPSRQVKSTLNHIKSVSDGKLDAAFGYTHNLSSRAPAALLFGSPIAGAGVGIDSTIFLSWFHNAGGSKLYDELWMQMGLNIKGFILQAAPPQSLGWFKEPITSLTDLQGNRLRHDSDISGKILREMGISIFPMKEADIIPELEKSNLDGVSWCCPKSDLELGVHEVVKNYYLQGIGANVLHTDLYINRDIYNNLTTQQKKAIEVSARASLGRYKSTMIYRNAKAVRDLIESHNVIIHDTPKEFFKVYLEKAREILEEKARVDPFFSKVWQSQKDFASFAVPYWDDTQIVDRILRKNYINEGNGLN